MVSFGNYLFFRYLLLEHHGNSLTESAHAGVLSADGASARCTVATRRIRPQTRVVPIAVAALVPGHTLTTVVTAAIDAGARPTIMTRCRGAGVGLQLSLAAGSRASGRTYTAEQPGTI